jgi:outer membrane lipoprotein carrier protein
MTVLPYRPSATVAGCLLAACLGAAAAAAPAGRPPAALAHALQQKYDAVKDFSADFVHQYRGGVLRKVVTERGHLVVKKPGMMRWTYDGADRKVFVSDGRKMYSYLPTDRQVYVAAVPQDGQASTPALFLAGKGNLVRDFAVSAAPVPAGAPAGSTALKLVPERGDRDYDWLVIVVDEGSLAWRMLVTGDRQGGESTFTFSNLKENRGVADREFAFQIPRGVDVITDPPARP